MDELEMQRIAISNFALDRIDKVFADAAKSSGKSPADLRLDAIRERVEQIMAFCGRESRGDFLHSAIRAKNAMDTVIEKCDSIIELLDNAEATP